MSALWRTGGAGEFLLLFYLLCVKTAMQPVPFMLNRVKQMLLSGEVPAAIAALI
jgi:hypothetical protein